MAKKAEALLTVIEVRQRIKLGQRFMAQFVANDVNACLKYLDPSEDAGTSAYTYTSDETGTMEYEDISGIGQVAGSIPIGTGNATTVNLLTKIAATAVNDPDWHVVAKKPPEQQPQQGQDQGQGPSDDPESAEIGRQWFRQLWDSQNIKRSAIEPALLKCDVSGLGFLFTLWDPDNRVPITEHVQSWDIAVDPFVKNWQKPKWIAKKRRISLRQADEEYPGFFSDKLSKNKGNGDYEKVSIWIYWDKKQELHLHDGGGKDATLLNKGKTTNKYGFVPTLAIEGDLHPGGTSFPLGLAVIASGAQAELADMNLYVSNSARHGAPITCITPGALNDGEIEKLKNGSTQEAITLKGTWDTQNPPIFRVPGEQISNAVLEAKREARNDMDGLMGIGAGDRGLFDQKPQFATEVAYVASRGGARQNRAKLEYETVLNRWAKRMLWLMVNFGGPEEDDQGNDISTDEEKALHKALSNIVDVQVVESSTLFKDPGMEQQQSMQLLQMVGQSYPMLLTLNQLGIMQELPDMKKILERVFRAFGVNQTQQMFVPVQGLPQQGQQGKPPIENINYKDAPDDVKRQMEQQAGLQPSQMQTPPDNSGQMDIAKEVTRGHVDISTQSHQHQQEVKMALLNHMLDMNKMAQEQRHEAMIHGTQLQNQKQIAAMRPKSTNGAKK